MSLFEKAKKIETVTPAPKKKTDKERINIPGLANLAVVDAIVKGFTAIRSTLDEKVKAEMAATFVGIGNQTKRRPENFRGVEGDVASASCELRTRSSASPLAPEEIDVLKRLEIPVEEIETKADCYVINPAYFEDSELLEKVSKALEKVKGLPEDFILKQDRQVKTVVTAETVDTVFEKGLQKTLLDMVCTMAIKPVYDASLSDAVTAGLKLAGLAETVKEKTKVKAKG